MTNGYTQARGWTGGLFFDVGSRGPHEMRKQHQMQIGRSSMLHFLQHAPEV